MPWRTPDSGRCTRNLGESALSREHREKAYALRDKVSERERLYITAHYFASVENDPGKAADIYELWKKTYPRDSTPYTNVGLIYAQQGNDDRALESYLQAIELEPGPSFPYTNAASIYMNKGRFDEAAALLEKLLERSGDSPSAHVMLFGLAARKGDKEIMEEHAAAVRGTPAEAEVLGFRAEMELFAGHVNEFRRLVEEAGAVAARYGLQETAVGTQGTFAWVDALLGYTGRARAEAQRALNGPPSPKVTRNAAMALAVIGDVAAAEKAYATVREDALKTGIEGSTQDAVFRAIVAIQRGRPSEAVELLEPLRAFEERWPAQLGSRLARGRAYLAGRRFEEAEREFAEIVKRRDLMPFDVVCQLALLDMARGRAASGNAAGAREAYEQVLELWKDADPDLPLLKDVRAALGRPQTN